MGIMSFPMHDEQDIRSSCSVMHSRQNDLP
jgi:hypothetical protein